MRSPGILFGLRERAIMLRRRLELSAGHPLVPLWLRTLEAVEERIRELELAARTQRSEAR